VPGSRSCEHASPVVCGEPPVLPRLSTGPGPRLGTEVTDASGDARLDPVRAGTGSVSRRFDGSGTRRGRAGGP